MQFKNIYNLISVFLILILPNIFMSCKDDELELEPDESIESMNPFVSADDLSISFITTLDAMGDEKGEFNPYEEIEKYIDPQKFRVLFFDSNNNFLFESKNRWVKKLETDPDDKANARWYVSVPLYSYGNDWNDYDWDWDNIINVLKTENFKIALLVNRPLSEYCADYSTSTTGDSQGAAAWFPTNNPDWTRADSRFGPNGENKNCKKVFDIHHSQEDPTYQVKSWPSGWTGAEGFYDFIMTNNQKPDSKGKYSSYAKMSPYVSWIDFHGEEEKTNSVEVIPANTANNNSPQNFRKVLLPNESHPIPMYGIQEFSPVGEDWQKGMPFTLNRTVDKPIALLRSAVKLDLVLPANKKPDQIMLMYSNIYSRCEPIDVWTNTGDLWKDHTNGCEWEDIMKYGPLSLDGDENLADNNMTTINTYRKRMSWLYGCWLDNNDWTFGSLGVSGVVKAGGTVPPHPHIFNPMTQRNVGVFVYGNTGKDLDKDGKPDLFDDVLHVDNLGNLHFIFYTGERNINDPSSLAKKNGANVGARTLVFWALVYGNTIYVFPIANYNVGNTYLTTANLGTTTYDKTKETFQKFSNTTGLNNYATYVSKTNTATNHRPWPLIRNHVYRMKLGATKGDEDNFVVQSEHLYSKDIYFPNPKSLNMEEISIPKKAELKEKQ